MLDYLESVLASEHVVVKSGQFIVEVKPQVCHILAFAFDVYSLAISILLEESIN